MLKVILKDDLGNFAKFLFILVYFDRKDFDINAQVIPEGDSGFSKISGKIFFLDFFRKYPLEFT